MKKTASTLLCREQFWKIIDNSNNGKELEQVLATVLEDEILGYTYWWSYFHRQSYTQALWAVAYTVLGGCSDDSFDYFRYWLITRGESVYMAALEDADSLCDEFEKISDGEYPEWEEVDYIAGDVFEKKFGKELDDAMANVDYGETVFPELVFAWDQEDEDSIRKICPNTFDTWWNGKFW